LNRQRRENWFIRLAVVSLMKKEPVRKFRYWLLGNGARVGIFLIRILPRRVGLMLFSGIGSLVYRIPHEDRKRTLRHLRMIFGTVWTDEKIRKTAANVYRELGKNLYDAFYLTRIPPEKFNRLVSSDPIDRVDAAYREGRGVIVITAHIGCFEMLLHFFPVKGYRSFAVGRRMRDERLERIVRSLRSGDDIVYMDRSESTRNIIRHLNDGRMFGVLVDQDTAVEGVYAEFLDRPAYTPSGPLKLAMKFGYPAFIITAVRLPGDTHHINITGPLELRTGNGFESDLLYNVTMVNRHIGDTIINYPEQWVWMHRRWRRQPEGTTGSVEKNS
jgi:KDO2-lipid IV(A) lauroyltransferase